MRRAIPFLLLLGLVAACDGTPGTSSSTQGGGADTATQPQKHDPVAPVTGVSNIQARLDEFEADITNLEARKKELQDKLAATSDDKEKETVQRDLGGVQSELKMIIKNLEYLMIASDVGLKAKAREIVQARYTNQRTELAKLIKEQAGLRAEIDEMRQTLALIDKGQGKPPAGFTEAELRDRQADFEAKVSELESQEATLRKEMKKNEDLLGQAEIPLEDRTLLSDTRSALEKAKQRAESLLEP